ncbi:DUF4097 family beta strand repeat-containing protein, partial [Kineococcus indalonis]|uniref:DUF4097 family beta strand repeat-containing protein n=1 Tax=Kineococcus indalonis TaxID=2696566 RepID=UPI0014124F77
PHPVPVVVDVPFANLHVVAGEREDVVVTVLPTDPAKSGSVRAAEEVRVVREGEAVSVTHPGSWKQFVLPFAAGGTDITVELPTGCDLRGKTGSLHAEGALGAVQVTLSAGDARLEDVERLELKASAGSVAVARVAGGLDVKASAGSVRIGEVAGHGTIRAGNGTTTVGALTGTLQVHGAHADIEVSHVHGTLTARSAHSGIRVGALHSGRVTLTNSFGSIEVGVPAGTAAHLDVSSEHGSVRNHLTPTDGPVADEATAEVHASTGYGDVIVRRS